MMELLMTLGAIALLVLLVLGLMSFALRGGAKTHQRAQALGAALEAARPAAHPARARVVSSEVFGADTLQDAAFGQHRMVTVRLAFDADPSGGPSERVAFWEVQLTAMPKVAPDAELDVAVHPREPRLVFPAAPWARVSASLLVREEPALAESLAA